MVFYKKKRSPLRASKNSAVEEDVTLAMENLFPLLRQDDVQLLTWKPK